jgi:hypothetical protein
LGIEQDLKPKTKGQGVCIRYFTPKPGVLKAVEGAENLKRSFVYDAEIYHKIGDTIPEVRSSLDRSGHVIVTGETAEIAIGLADNLINQVKFIIE